MFRDQNGSGPDPGQSSAEVLCKPLCSWTRQVLNLAAERQKTGQTNWTTHVTHDDLMLQNDRDSFRMFHNQEIGYAIPRMQSLPYESMCRNIECHGTDGTGFYVQMPFGQPCCNLGNKMNVTLSCARCMLRPLNPRTDINKFSTRHGHLLQLYIQFKKNAKKWNENRKTIKRWSRWQVSAQASLLGGMCT